MPVLIYSFVGVELPSTAAEEMIEPRRSGRVPVVIGLVSGVVSMIAVLVNLYVTDGDNQK